MLPKHHRLTRNLFAETFRRGKVHHSPHIMAKFFPSHKNESRYSVVVSKKIAKKAVDRNRIRRKIYTILNTIPQLLTTPLYGVFVMKKGIQDVSHQDLVKEINSLVDQVHGK